MKSIFKKSWLLTLMISLLMISTLGLAPTPAYAAGTVTVTKTADTNDGVCDNDCSLREAIAGAAPGDTITFDSALSGGTIHFVSTLTLAQDITIDGSDLASKITLSGDSDNNGVGDVRVFQTTGHNLVHVALNSLIVTKGFVSGGDGGGLLNDAITTITNSIFDGNTADNGGAITTYGALTIIDSTFSGNSSTASDGQVGGGAILNIYTLSITGSTFSGNTADASGGAGGAIYNVAQGEIYNSTFSGNSAAIGGAILTTQPLTITNSTISGNSAITTGGLIIGALTTNLANTIIANNFASYGPSNDDCTNDGTLGVNTNNLIEDGSCSPSLSGDPNLGPLADNGGPTQTMALLPGSPAFDAGDDANCPATDQRGLTRPQGPHCDIGAYEHIYANVSVNISGTQMAGSPFNLRSEQSTRASFGGVNNGSVNITSTYNNISILGAERVIYKVNNANTSFSELMGLPNGQLDTTYWLPWYNNVDLDTQLRFANVSGSTATVHLFIGGVEKASDCTPSSSPFTLASGASLRVSCAGVNSGPVQIVSDQNIVAAERVIYKVNNTPTSFSEMMALPNNQLDTMYWLPWYNNVDLDSQLRFANVSGSTATVHVFIGGVEMTGSPFTLTTSGAGQSTRVSFNGVNNGPVQIVSDQNIVAAERVIYKVNNINTSFSELMALPNGQLDTNYWLPLYNNIDLDTQVRFANVSGSTATVHVYVGGVEMVGSPFTLTASGTGQSTRVSFVGINNGPVQVVSDVPIVAAERVIYKVNNTNTSFSELMALPNGQLDTTYWLPWYNNIDLETQLRFGVP